MRGRGKIRIWPAYFNIQYSREEGRRVPRSIAVRDPKIDELEKAALKLGLKTILKPGAAYSKHPWKKTGVLLVDKKGSKKETIKMIAEELK